MCALEACVDSYHSTSMLSSWTHVWCPLLCVYGNGGERLVGSSSSHTHALQVLPQVLPVMDAMLVNVILNAVQWNWEDVLDPRGPTNQLCLTVKQSNDCANTPCSGTAQLPNLSESTMKLDT